MEVDALEPQKNAKVLDGDWVAALADYAAKDMHLQVDDHPVIVGRDACVQHQRSLMTSLVLHSAALLDHVVTEHLAWSLWRFAWTYEGERQRVNQVAMRRWRDGRLSRERIVSLSPGVEDALF